MTDRYDRALGALTGLAVGDALGMPTQLLPRQRILERYGALTWFLDAPDDTEISQGTPAGRVTDDIDQALIHGRLLVEGAGRVDPQRLADELLRWETRMVDRGVGGPARPVHPPRRLDSPPEAGKFCAARGFRAATARRRATSPRPSHARFEPVA